MKFGIGLGLVLIVFCSVVSAEVSLRHDPDSRTITVKIDDELFTEYVYGNRAKPILYPIIGPHEISMTRHYPMKKGVANEATDHVHHQSLHFNHGNVNGVDFWHGGKGERIRCDEIVASETVDGSALIVSRSSWVHGDKVVCTDTTEISCGVTEGGRFIDYKVSIHASHGDVTFGDTKEGTMSIRTHPALRLTGKAAKGSAINSEGVEGKALWAKAAKWVDYWGPIGEKTVGIAIFDHPENPRHPTTWHARDYGLVTANPYAKKHFKRGEGPLTITSGKSVTFAYRFFFHKGSHQDAKIPAAYDAWGKAYKQKAEYK